MLVSDKRTEDPTVSGLKRYGLSRARLCEWRESRNGRRIAANPYILFSPADYAQFDASRHPDVQTADVVSLYWINGGFISPETLGRIDKPLIWRLSDAWPFTGGCHYPGTCINFEQACGQCPQLCQPSIDDVSHQLWLRKRSVWRKLDLTITTPSHWMADLARRSSLFADHRIEVIPTGVDLDCYYPGDRQESKARWGLPQDRLLILFGALGINNDLRKGYRELRIALEIIACSPLAPQVLAVVFGSDSPMLADLPVAAVSLGRLRSDEVLAAAYNCADVVVVPSLEDNLPNVALEAVACGAPVAAFNVGGMSDIVLDDWNGRLAPPGKPEYLGQALVEMLMNGDKLQAMRLNARLHAQQHFSLTTQAEAYIRLYKQIVSRRSNQGNL